MDSIYRTLYGSYIDLDYIIHIDDNYENIKIKGIDPNQIYYIEIECKLRETKVEVCLSKLDWSDKDTIGRKHAVYVLKDIIEQWHKWKKYKEEISKQ